MKDATIVAGHAHGHRSADGANILQVRLDLWARDTVGDEVADRCRLGVDQYLEYVWIDLGGQCMN